MTRTRRAGIVGRAGPLRRLDDALTESAQGRAGAVFVSGEAGMGKTSLIDAALDGVAGKATVGWGTCWHGEGAPGFWPWTQALGDVARAVGVGEAVRAAGTDRKRLALVVREMGSHGTSSDDPDRHRLLLLDATLRWLTAVAKDRHVVVVLDDLQWADASTLDLLQYVIAAPLTARLLVIGAYRHDELSTDAASRLAGSSAISRHVPLEGLTVAEVEKLAARICGPTVAARRAEELQRRTAGHPMFVEELAALDAGAPMPTAVTAAVSRRLDSLPEESRRLLDVASVLGNRLLPDVLAAAAGATPGVVIRQLSPAVSAGLLSAGPASELRFTHDLFRETVYGALDPSHRTDLHGRVAEALEARHDRGGRVAVGDLARHFTLAIERVDPARAIHWARRAATGDRIRLALSEAAGHLRRLRDAAADAGLTIDVETLVALLMEEAEHRARSGEVDVARGVLHHAAEIATSPAMHADVALAVQRLGAKFSTPRDDIVDRLQSALEGVTGLDITREAQLTAALARELQHSVAEDRVRAVPLSERALVLGRASGHDKTVLACLLARHDALWTPGTGAERAELGREIANVGARLGDVDRTAEGLLLEANGLLESGSAAFRPVLDRWFGLLEERDEPRDRYMVRTRRAALAVLEGDADRATTLMDESVRMGERIQEPDAGNVFMSQRVALAGIRDDPDELRALAVDAVRWWTGAPVLAHAVAAGAYARAGDLEAASSEVAMVSESGGWRAENSYLRSVLVMHLGDAATALGDGPLCRSLLEDLDQLSGSCGVNGAVVAFAGPFAHTAGLLARTLGDDGLADRMLHESIETCRRLGATVWARRSARCLRTRSVERAPGAATDAGTASLERAGRIWTVTWPGEGGRLPHVKGLTDIATLVARPGRDISALELASEGAVASVARSEVIDVEALRAYRLRLAEIDAAIAEAEDHADIGRVEALAGERDALLSELRRTTGLGGRVRVVASDPAERARKAVSARIRDAIRRIEAVAPQTAAHLDRSIHTGLRCAYRPPAGEEVRWRVQP